jgi:hypothetical protein
MSAYAYVYNKTSVTLEPVSSPINSSMIVPFDMLGDPVVSQNITLNNAKNGLVLGLAGTYIAQYVINNQPIQNSNGVVLVLVPNVVGLEATDFTGNFKVVGSQCGEVSNYNTVGQCIFTAQANDTLYLVNNRTTSIELLYVESPFLMIQAPNVSLIVNRIA